MVKIVKMSKTKQVKFSKKTKFFIFEKILMQEMLKFDKKSMFDNDRLNHYIDLTNYVCINWADLKSLKLDGGKTGG
jgi:hypothetical protein